MIEHDYQALAEELGVRGRCRGNELRAGCPIHGGRDANFTLNIHTGQWMCHSQCGGGNFYRLVRAVFGVTMTSAMDWVIEHDVSVPAIQEEEPQQIGPPLWEVQYQAASDNELPRWWFDRGFDWADAKDWRVKWDGKQQQLLIPCLWRGDLVGVIARNMARKPKYQNSPKLPKSKILFGARNLDQAIVLVEGAADCMWLHKHGLNAVALLGLTMTDQQRLLLRNSPEVVLALDNDEHGRDAQREIVESWQGTRLASQLTMITFPERMITEADGTERPIKDVGECSAAELSQMAAERRVAV